MPPRSEVTADSHVASRPTSTAASRELARERSSTPPLKHSLQPYSGRLIFDHFPKTAGQAINAWLAEALGNGTVSPNMIASQRDLLSYAGTYPILSAHVLFGEGDGLDSRFQYATLLRDPVDRVISWLHFVVHNHATADFPEINDACSAYLESDGEEFRPVLVPHLLNTCTMHFAAIHGANGLNDSELVDTAFRAISSYDCLGIYERLDEFVASLATLIGIPAPDSLRPLNVTTERPAVNSIGPKLRDSILKLTALDRQRMPASYRSSRSDCKARHPPRRCSRNGRDTIARRQVLKWLSSLLSPRHDFRLGGPRSEYSAAAAHREVRPRQFEALEL